MKPLGGKVKGGFPLGVDGRIHTTFTHNPSTLRLSSIEPNMQNIPRGGGLGKIVKAMFVAPEGYTFWERDFSAIEAVLVGYFAGSKRYVTAAKLGIHDFVAAQMVGQPASFEWETVRLRSHLKSIKSNFKPEREIAKRIVHGGNYGMTPAKMWLDFPEMFASPNDARDLQELYFGLFPEIKEWHRDIALRVDATKKRGRDVVEGEFVEPWSLGVSHAVNPFGYRHEFYNVLEWTRLEPPDVAIAEWVWNFGDDAKRLWGFFPQSTAAGIIKHAAKQIWLHHRHVGETMRLLIHDAIFGESPLSDVTEALRVSRLVMEAPIPQLPLPPDWGMGEYLTIGTEAKVGPVWADMRTVEE